MNQAISCPAFVPVPGGALMCISVRHLSKDPETFLKRLKRLIRNAKVRSSTLLDSTIPFNPNFKGVKCTSTRFSLSGYSLNK